MVLQTCPFPMPETPPPPQKKKNKLAPLGWVGEMRNGLANPAMLLAWLQHFQGGFYTLRKKRFFADKSHFSFPPPPPPPNELAPSEWAREMCNPLAHPMVILVWLQYAQGRLFTEYQITFLRLASPRFKLYPPEPARTMRN